MSELYTDIHWQLSNYCKAECSYCPTSLRGGEYPEEDKDYVKIAKLILDHYNLVLNRNINWTFDGGEPLDLNNLTRILKTAKSDRNNVILHTNGGYIWMDWWAIEPYVDKIVLSYHYWQNKSLIKYILDIFKEKNKSIFLKMPIRPDYFEEDMARVKITEEENEIKVSKVILYKNATRDGGMFSYSKEQLMELSGIKPTKIITIKEPEKIVPLIKEKKEFETKPYQQRLEEKIKSNPSYLGQLCNVGIEKLVISYNGYVSGSNCNNQPLGNIWNNQWAPPDKPQICGMLSCMNKEDQKITKFTSQTQN